MKTQGTFLMWFCNWAYCQTFRAQMNSVCCSHQVAAQGHRQLLTFFSVISSCGDIPNKTSLKPTHLRDISGKPMFRSIPHSRWTALTWARLCLVSADSASQMMGILSARKLHHTVTVPSSQQKRTLQPLRCHSHRKFCASAQSAGGRPLVIGI